MQPEKQRKRAPRRRTKRVAHTETEDATNVLATRAPAKAVAVPSGGSGGVSLRMMFAGMVSTLAIGVIVGGAVPDAGPTINPITYMSQLQSVHSPPWSWWSSELRNRIKDQQILGATLGITGVVSGLACLHSGPKAALHAGQLTWHGLRQGSWFWRPQNGWASSIDDEFPHHRVRTVPYQPRIRPLPAPPNTSMPSLPHHPALQQHPAFTPVCMSIPITSPQRLPRYVADTNHDRNRYHEIEPLPSSTLTYYQPQEAMMRALPPYQPLALEYG